MERLKFWLLDAVHYRDELACQAIRGSLYTQVPHGEKPSTAAKILVELGLAGLVEFKHGREVIRPNEFDPKNTKIAYSLTESGGLTWERFAKPNWQKSFSKSEAWLNDNEAFATPNSAEDWNLVREDYYHIPQIVCTYDCGSVELMETMLDGLCPKSSRLYTSPIYEILKWKPLYWKTLSNGFRTIVVTNDVIDGDIDGDWRWDEELPKWREFGFNPATCRQVPTDSVKDD